ncbi:DUF5680 domain-containing protein [Acetivibrio saccincola]|jgi:transcriptional regulator with XRE-family HTH domain|uniref:Transcriptional regulator n=1 Tax=Acetivibrio saccincola TaxID=1677857 RepID=A0A2K9EEE8_9FIRM|nr:DUF5680 domain-containing protein [Acetivibrio saccincola]AUG58524.1 HTH-type transcriptional regulator ImmR [Acetivibrio saccincola]NLW27195.1 helix-turn-helix transcriptional regulator [Acetivibrio saccincola]PQQ66278.1 transcriptional regulator [Acetivibrio saccincola]HOA96714.1 DUF5680 domain-containing protein [Acetivibrio saccincola]HQD29282.1 DUF5680 domain-containing protein [Acetivibrio saccincola]
MIFSEKLSLIRKSKGYTQEQLAEILGVSRQAVAKWESGQSYPDISNLIQISEEFHVTVDYLVRDSVCQKKPTYLHRGQIEIVDFLIKAKKETYAGNGPESKSIYPGSYILEYREGDFLYIDTYYGGEAFIGEEVVWMKDTPVYGMNYCGRVIGDNFSGDFLKAALLAVPQDMPYRGPSFFEEQGYIYRCSTKGDMNWFQGYENIYYDNEKIYECYFHGGGIR